MSKIQPMDTGIIVLFKLYYCCLQLQHAIDLDEASERDIYKVSTETIKHCWSYIKIVSLRDEAGMPISTPSQIDALCICTPILIKNWLNPKDEQEVYQQFTDKNFIQGVIKIEQEEEEEILEPTLTTKEKLNVLRDAIKIVTEM
ncbi:25442_t:CDS:2, partial [Racocetra persica]